MDKPIFLGFAVLELSKLHMYETYYDILQPYFGEKNLQVVEERADQVGGGWKTPCIKKVYSKPRGARRGLPT